MDIDLMEYCTFRIGCFAAGHAEVMEFIVNGSVRFYEPCGSYTSTNNGKFLLHKLYNLI